MYPIQACLEIATLCGHLLSTEKVSDDNIKLAQSILNTSLVYIRDDFAQVSAQQQGIITR